MRRRLGRWAILPSLLLLLLTGHALWSDQAVVSRYVSTIFPTVATFTAGLKAPRVTGSGVAPTCSSTGLGTGSAAIVAGSTDFAGECFLSPTGAPAATGVITLTFTTGSGAYGTAGGPFCVLMGLRDTGSFDQRFTVKGQGIPSNTAPTFGWDNNAVALTAGTTYGISYICIGR